MLQMQLDLLSWRTGSGDEVAAGYRSFGLKHGDAPEQRRAHVPISGFNLHSRDRNDRPAHIWRELLF